MTPRLLSAMGFAAALSVLTGPVPATERGAALELDRVTPGFLAGRYEAPRLGFFARLEPDELVTVEISLASGTRLEAAVDYRLRTLRVEAVSAAAAATSLTPGDLAALERLARDLASRRLPDAGAELDALQSLLALVGDYPSGTPLLIWYEPTTPVSPDEAVSICNSIGTKHPYTFVGDEGTVTGTVTVGPCAKGGCVGRCGSGCSYNPGNPTRTQRFTQDCLNHDMCRQTTGDNATGQCKEEFDAAVDDYAFGTDCNSIGGGWTFRLEGETCIRPSDCGGVSSTRTYTFKADPRATARGFKGKGPRSSTDRRQAILKGKRKGGRDVKGKWKIPNYMGQCNNRPSGFASGKFTGQNLCGRLELELTGDWGWYNPSSCRDLGDHPFEGTMTGSRNGAASRNESSIVQPDSDERVSNDGL